MSESSTNSNLSESQQEPTAPVRVPLDGARSELTREQVNELLERVAQSPVGSEALAKLVGAKEATRSKGPNQEPTESPCEVGGEAGDRQPPLPLQIADKLPSGEAINAPGFAELSAGKCHFYPAATSAVDCFVTSSRGVY